MTEPHRNTSDDHGKKCCVEDAARIRAPTSARLIALFAQEQYQRTILASQISCLPIWYLYPCAAIRAWCLYPCADRRFRGANLLWLLANLLFANSFRLTSKTSDKTSASASACADGTPTALSRLATLSVSNLNTGSAIDRFSLPRIL